jgi:hypothetical protein
VRQVRIAAVRVFIEPGPSLGLRFRRMRTGPRRYQLASIPAPPESHLSVQVIVKDGSIPWQQERPRLLQMNREDVKNDFTLSKALHRLREASETLPALKTTTRVTFVRACAPNIFYPFAAAFH